MERPESSVLFYDLTFFFQSIYFQGFLMTRDCVQYLQSISEIIKKEPNAHFAFEDTSE